MSVSASITNARVEPAGGGTASSPSIPLKVLRATVTFDRTWSPYIQGTLVCVLQGAAAATATDPRRGLCVKFTMTASYLGQTVNLDLTAWLRSRSADLVSGETTLTFASVESLLQDAVDISGQGYGAAVNDTQVLADAINRLRWPNAVDYPLPTTATTIDGSAAFSIAASDAGWDPGVTLWEVVSGVEEPKSLWIRGDESGTAILRMDADYAADTTVKTYTGTDRILSVTDVVDRDNPDWANGVYINYPNSSSNFTDYGNANNGAPLKSVVLTRKTKKAASGAAAARAARMKKRGRNLQITAIADLSCRPNQRRRVQYRGYDWTGPVQSVTFRYPEVLMDLLINVDS